ncbi:hypothetical protein Tco_1168796, partial [Tanacetum coccineum]
VALEWLVTNVKTGQWMEAVEGTCRWRGMVGEGYEGLGDWELCLAGGVGGFSERTEWVLGMRFRIIGSWAVDVGMEGEVCCWVGVGGWEGGVEGGMGPKGGMSWEADMRKTGVRELRRGRICGMEGGFVATFGAG